METSKLNILEQLDNVLRERKQQKRVNSYLSRVSSKGNTYVNSKIREDCNEYIEYTCGPDRQHMIHETADLWFHTLVSLSLNEISSSDILKELERRFGLSGIDEKRLRKK